MPPNLQFQLDDLEEDWTFTDKFTYIHGRMIFPCFRGHAKVINQAFYALNPGGFLEIQDALLWVRCDDRSLEGTAIAMWQTMLHEAAWKSGRDWACPTKYKRYMEDTGFVDVTVMEYKWPINTWPIDKHEKELGLWSFANLVDGLESISMAPMTRYLDKTEDEVRKIINCVENEIRNQNIHAYIPM